MKLKIDENTKWDAVLPFMTEDAMKELQKRVSMLFPFDFYKITIGCFSEMVSEMQVFPNLEDYDKYNLTVFQYIKIKNALDFLDEFANILKKYNAPPSAKETMALSAVPNFTIIENMLCFVQKFFNLHNFHEAENITILDFILAKKSDYAQKIFDKNYYK
jgi:hypothetical protein